MLLELEVLDDFRKKKADHIRHDRGPVPGSNLLGHTRPTDQVPPLDNQDFPTLPRQIIRADETVVSCSNDDAIVHLDDLPFMRSAGHAFESGALSVER